MIEMINLTKKYGEIKAVNDLTLRIDSGLLFGFLGPNGAGKTTTINMLTGITKPTSGTARICGYDIRSNINKVKAITGLMPDTPNLYENLTGMQFVLFVAQIYGVDTRLGRKRAEELFEMFDLSDVAGEAIKGYSHGMKKKLLLTSLIVQNPDVYFLDEPTSGLDPRSARLAKELLQELCSQGKTIFMTTHVLEIAERMCDRIAIIDRGRLIAEGSLEDLRGLSQEKDLEDIFLKLTDQNDSEPSLPTVQPD